MAHDRYFLNRVTDHILSLYDDRARVYRGNYQAFADQRENELITRSREVEKQQKEIEHQEAVIKKLQQFNREKSIKRAESREKMLEKMEVLEKPAQLRDDMRLELKPRIESGTDVLSAEHLSKSFEYPLFSDLNIEIRKGERIALIGNNGTGKSTLLKILIGRMEADEGSVRLGTKVHIGYYDQEHQILHPDKTLFEELQDAYPAMDNTAVRNVLASFLFTGDDAFKLVSDLSGGERGRLSLARLMLSESNFLILDEPTNHLDIVSKEILEDAICSYQGTVLCVSHDRYFINRIATRILDLTGRTLVSYLGNYDYYLEKHDELTRIFAPESAGETHSSGGTIRVSDSSHLAMEHKKASADKASAADNWKKRREQQEKKKKKASLLEKTEKEIVSCEERDALIDEELAKEEVYTDLEKVTAFTREKAEIAEKLDELYKLWEELAE